MELIAHAALACSPQPKALLDIGCGAGNNTLKLLQSFSPIDCDLIDLSLPMLSRAQERISEVNHGGRIRTFQGDFRTLDLPASRYDIIFAAAVLHHLRGDADWEESFNRIFGWTAPGGSVWMTDLVFHETREIQALMWERYARYLESAGGEEYRDEVFEYIDLEDSPRPLTYQLDLLRKVGFDRVEILHKNSCFAAFGGIKDRES